jgi:hypothetical protein
MKIKIDFRKEEIGAYNEEKIKKAWKNSKIISTLAKPEIVKEGDKKVLQLTFQKVKLGRR